MTDVNDIKAGKYELVAEHWDEITSKPNEPLDFVRHRKGDIVTLNIEHARRLVSTGAVIEPGSRQRAVAEYARAQFMASLAALSEEERTAVLADIAAQGLTTPGAAADGAAAGAGGTAGEDVAKPPPKAAKVEFWRSWGVQYGGLTQEQADVATKDQLIGLSDGTHTLEQLVAELQAS